MTIGIHIEYIIFLLGTAFYSSSTDSLGIHRNEAPTNTRESTRHGLSRMDPSTSVLS